MHGAIPPMAGGGWRAYNAYSWPVPAAARRRLEGGSSGAMGRFVGYVVRTLEAVPSLRRLGWGFLVAWGTVSSFSGALPGGGAPRLGTYWLANMAATAAGLLLLGLLWRRAAEPGPSTSGMALSAALVVASTLAVALIPDGSGAPWEVAQAAAGVCSGAGMALGTLCWGCYYAGLDAQEIESCTICSLVLMIACYCLGLACEGPAAVALLVALPCCSCACFFLCRGGSAPDGACACSCPRPDEPAPSMRGLARTGVGVAVAGCVVSALWSLSGTGSVRLGGDMFALSLLSGAAVALALVVWCVTFANRLNLNTLYRWVVPLVALSLALFAAPGAAAAFCGNLCAFAAQMGLDILSFIYYCELASRRPGQAGRVVGLGRFFLEGGIFAGCLAARWEAGLVEASAATFEQVLLAMGAALVASAMFAMVEQGPAAAPGAEEAGEAGGAAGGAGSPGGRDDPSRRAFLGMDGACDIVAGRFALSPREREVLGYLARGRSLPYIRNELSISKSTASRHVEHIYAKTGVHSREELISLVERAAREGRAG